MKPIIDVHAHIFSARDIPLYGYLHSRKDEGGLEKLMRKYVPIVAKWIRQRPSERKQNTFLASLEREFVMNLIYLVMGQQYRGWVETLSKEVVDITRELLETYDKDGIDLYVPLVIDYEYWFKSTRDTPIRDQITNICDKVVIPYKGRIHPFVPFDPARELAFRKGMLNPDKEPEQHGSLELVKEAIENKGFIGVKLYNSLGYKPFNNVSVEDNRRRHLKLHRKRGYAAFTGDEYDQVLSELYDYCVANGVPITAHSVMEGIESYKDASFDFGHAKFWRDVLSQPKYQSLHLNLAHFGWGRLGYHWEHSWVKDICAMLLDYDNMYADVACHGITSADKAERFKSDYRDMRREWTDKRGPNAWHDIKKKLLFAIDWHVIKRNENFENFKDCYVEVLRHDNLFSPKDIDDFLGGNALRFLGLLPGAQNRKRLAAFYRTNHIPPPEWFRSTEKQV